MSIQESLERGANGNCLFHSVSYLITGNPTYHFQLRTACFGLLETLDSSNLLENRYNEYKLANQGAIIPIDQSDKQKYHLIGESCGELMLLLLASILNIEIITVFKPDRGDEYRHDSHPPIFSDNYCASPEKLFLHFFTYGHFKPIIGFSYTALNTEPNYAPVVPFIDYSDERRGLEIVDVDKIKEHMENYGFPHEK